MEHIGEVDVEWFKSHADLDAPTEGLFGLWAGGNLDGWIGRDGPMVRDCLGGQGGGRVKVLEGVPHAFCLSEWIPRSGLS